MTQPNPTGNGCSLEDCYTNLFALTDLCGIKWRSFAAKPENVTVDHLDDPVLLSFAKCLQSDILCVWRRVIKNSEQRIPDQLSASRELWIFWYGDEPVNLSELISKELQEVESGSWDKDKDNGLTYECRTLMFKALHNVIERSLLIKNFVRLGKWFVQPYDHNSSSMDRSSLLSFSFNFFLHGESTVCASIEVKQQPAVERLTPHHLTIAQENQATVHVILAPYGLNGTLTGHSYRDTDTSARKLWEEWSHFYPLDQMESKECDSRLPNLVEVLVAGVRMKYPSSYVLMCDSGDSPVRIQPLTVSTGSAPRSHYTSTFMTNGPLTPPASPGDPNIIGETGVKLVVNHGDGRQIDTWPVPSKHVTDSFGYNIVEKVAQDCCITAGIYKNSSENNTEDVTIGVWDCAEPATRANCNCIRLKNQKSRGLSSSQGKGGISTGGKHGKIDKPEKLERQLSRLNRTVNPFHRRSMLTDDLLQFDMDEMIHHVPYSAPFLSPGNAPLPQMPNNITDSVLDSPLSAQPSPLDEPRSQSMTTQPMDPTMPTLSPHPPAKAGVEKDSSSKTFESPTAVMCNGVTDLHPKPGEDTPKSEGDTSPNSWNQQESKHESVNNWLRSQQKHTEIQGLKRPSLPKLQSLEESCVSESFYNFDGLHTWLDFPVKRAKIDPKEDFSSVHQSHDLRQSSLQQKTPPKSSTPQPPAPSPYDFSDESSLNPGTSLRSFRNSRDDLFPRPSPFGKMDEDSKDPMRNCESFGHKDEKNGMDMGSLGSPLTPSNFAGSSLTREKDLIPHATDLDNLKIFESSDEDSNEGAFLEPGPAFTKVEDGRGTKVTNNATNGVEVIAASELARMFPTPPSLENVTELSPKGGLEITTENTAIEHSIKPDPMISVSMENIAKDPVFKPPNIALFITSPKYGPIELPSTELSPVPAAPEYKPSWHHFQMPLMEKPQAPTAQLNQYVNIPSVENLPSLQSRMTSSAIEASPATFPNSSQQRTPRTPMSYELQSPASNASSYLNKTLNSIDNQGTNNQIPEVHSLVVNVILSDSVLNLFKDHNFDSCNICVCNNSNMDITGADIGLYNPDNSHVRDLQDRCTCGFSAVMNRKYGHNSGLFYEDEVEITGIRDDRFDRRKPNLISLHSQKQDGDSSELAPIEDLVDSTLELLLGHFTLPYPSLLGGHQLKKMDLMSSTSVMGNTMNYLQFQDDNEATYAALEQGRQAMEHCSPSKLDDHPRLKNSYLHKWSYLQGASRIPINPQDVVRVLKSLQPILQDAIQSKRTTRLWEHTYKLSGPLTWKDFHQLAGRGSAENCEPQPIPSFLVGYDREWVSVAPYCIRYWEKQFLEPYGKQKDIAYVVVSPDNDFILEHVRDFYKELSSIYEVCRLGRHRPISKALRDGIMRVGKSAAQKLASEEVDEWFKRIGDSPVAAKLRLYAQVCRHHLGPHLAQQTLDENLFKINNSSTKSTFKTPEPPTPSSNDNQGTSSTSNAQPSSNPEEKENKEGSQPSENGSPAKEPVVHEVEQEDASTCPSLVIYLIDPFNYGQEWDDYFQINSRLAMVGLLRCYQELIKSLPDHLINNCSLQIVPLKTILDSRESGTHFQVMKSMAFSIFASCCWNLSHNVIGRSLTGFGPASAADLFLQKSEDHRLSSLKLYSPPIVLAPMKDKQSQLAESCGEKIEHSNILFCGYCLSEDQRWLIATCTDDRGEMIESCLVNIEIPNRNRRKKASARKIGLQKLWDFILSVISNTTMPCRLVIGRLGRLGQGELKGWSGLLSKKNLQRASKHVQEICKQCSNMNTSDIPSILSACLVSLELQPSFQLMDDCIRAEEKMSSNCPLQTPRDASCTHILVFPTSATATANTNPSHQEPGMELGGNQFEIADDATDALMSELNGDDYQDMNVFDVFLSMTGPGLSPPPQQSAPGSPENDRGNNKMAGPSTSGPGSTSTDPQDEILNLLQQPLAMGYYVSTASPGHLPKWFWSACPEKELQCPYTFKSALHIHCSSHQDDFYRPSHNRNTHPLDSSLTCDVLRFVLENYNALSWLTFDPTKNDRNSCLPIHFVVLMQMYHALNAYV